MGAQPSCQPLGSQGSQGGKSAKTPGDHQFRWSEILVQECKRKGKRVQTVWCSVVMRSVLPLWPTIGGTVLDGIQWLLCNEIGDAGGS
jgi:hypothetical protein